MDSTKGWLHAAIHPPKYFLVTLVVSLGGLLNGIDTGTIGAVTTMPYFEKQFGAIRPTIQGIVVSVVMLSAAIASFFAGDLSDSLGRPRAIAIGSIIYAVGAALEVAAMNLGMLITGRFVVGVGEGLYLSTLFVYMTEISPPRWRGALCTMVQLFITLGLVAGFFSTYGSVNIQSTLSWRLPFAIHLGVAVVFFFGACFYLPHSPRWLSYRGRRDEATKVWDDLGVSSAEREKDLLENPSGAEPLRSTPAEATESSHPTPAAPQILHSKLRAFVRIFAPESRKATFLALFMVAMQQLSGIDAIIYYAPQVFQQAGLASGQANFLASGVSAICIFTFTIPAVLLADKWGRRPSTIYGGLALFACMALMGLLYGTGSVHPNSGAGRWVVITTIYVFAIIYSMTWAIGLRIFASEIQPMETRATTTSLAQGLNFATNFLVAFITPVLLSTSGYAMYVLFAGCVAATIAVCVVWMPETKGKDLEQVREVFMSHKAKSVDWSAISKGALKLRGRVSRAFGQGRGHSGTAGGIELESVSGSSGHN